MPPVPARARRHARRAVDRRRIDHSQSAEEAGDEIPWIGDVARRLGLRYHGEGSRPGQVVTPRRSRGRRPARADRGGTVKAIVVREFGDPSVMRVEEVPDPEAGPGQVVVRIRAVGVNPVDTYIRKGAYARKPSLPYTPGADAAGTVKAVGAGVAAFRRASACTSSARSRGRSAPARSWRSAIPPRSTGLPDGGLVRAGRGDRRALRHRLPRALPPGAGAAGRNGAGPRRQRRRRHRGHPAGQRRRPGGARHGRHRPRPRPSHRAGRQPRVQPSGRRLPRPDHGGHRRPRRGHRPRDAGQREPQPRPRAARPQGPGDRHRQPRNDRDRPAPDDEQGHRHPRA